MRSPVYHAFTEPAAGPNQGRCELFADPIPGMAYALGVDCALGIPGKDRDAAILFDGQQRQAATIHGYFSTAFADPISRLVDHFERECGRRVLIVVEAGSAKEGMFLARELYDRGYWMYFNRKSDTRGRAVRDMLGHSPTQSDITVHWLRRDLCDDKVQIHDEELHRQLMRFGYRLRSSTADYDATFKNDGFEWGAPAGEHDDLVRACAYANAGVFWLPGFDPPHVPLKPASIGARLGYDKPEKPKRLADYWS